jgi:hypothetical protein
VSEAETAVLAALALVLLMSRGAALCQALPLLRVVKRYWEPPRGAGEALLRPAHGLLFGGARQSTMERLRRSLAALVAMWCKAVQNDAS